MDRYRGSDVAVASSGLTGGDTAVHWSGLVVDVDREDARAVLINRVAGHARFVSSAAAPSTVLPPIDDASVAAKRALRTIEDHTGRHIASVDGVVTPSRGEHGVDAFVITGQPAPPVRLGLLPLGESDALVQLVAASRRTITVIDVLAERVRTGDGTLSGVMLEQAVRQFRPDVLVLLEGSAADAEWPTASGTIAALINEGVVDLVIIVAADRFQQQAAQLIGNRADLRGIDPTDYSVVDIAAALESELHVIYNQRVRAHRIVPSIEPTHFVSRVRAGELVMRFLARRREQTVVGVDVADGTVIHWATPGSSDVIVRPDLDVHHNVRSALSLDHASILQWLPFTLSVEDLSHWILNRALRPWTQSASMHDAAIERAILVELLRSNWSATSAGKDGRIDLIIAGRPFAAIESTELAALTVLDVFQPAPSDGIVQIILDAEGLVSAVGAIGEQSPAMATDVIERDLLQPFAAAVIVGGRGSDGDLALRGQVRYEDGETVRFSVPFGGVYHLAWDDHQVGQLTLACESAFSIGDRQRVDLMIGPDGDLTVGAGGILIDARGRAIQRVSDPSLQATRVMNWFESLGLRI